MLDKILNKKITRKDFLKYTYIVIIVLLIGGVLKKLFTKDKKSISHSYGNEAYGGIGK